MRYSGVSSGRLAVVLPVVVLLAMVRRLREALRARRRCGRQDGGRQDGEAEAEGAARKSRAKRRPAAARSRCPPAGLLDKMAAAYRKASTYQDMGTVRMAADGRAKSHRDEKGVSPSSWCAPTSCK